MIKYIILYLFTVNCLWAGPFKDGQWNGKPWKKAHLLSEVEKGNSDALAEWAMCSNYALLGISYDEDLIEKRSLLAIEGGSTLAKAFYGNYLIASSDEEFQKLGYRLSEDAVALGHPLAISGLARRYLFGTNVELDMEKAYELLKQSEKFNCNLAIGILGFYHGYDANKKRYDVNKSIFYRKKSLSDFMSIYAAVNLNNLLKNDDLEPFHHLIDLDTLDAADLRLVEAARLNHPYALVYVARNYVDVGKPHQAVPLMIRAANRDNQAARAIIAKWLENGYYLDSDEGKEIVANGAYADAVKFAGLSFRKGDRSSQTLRNYAKQLYWDKVEDPEKRAINYEKAEALLLTRLNSKGEDIYDCNCHDTLASGLLKVYNDDELIDDAVRDRAVAHYIYHSDHSDRNSYWIAWYFLQNKKNKLYDPVKGITAAKLSLKTGNEKYNKTARKKIRKASVGLTDEQQAEIDMLTEDGYPTAEKYRKEAYEYLLRIGDLSPAHSFRSNP